MAEKRYNIRAAKSFPCVSVSSECNKSKLSIRNQLE